MAGRGVLSKPAISACLDVCVCVCADRCSTVFLGVVEWSLSLVKRYISGRGFGAEQIRDGVMVSGWILFVHEHMRAVFLVLVFSALSRSLTHSVPFCGVQRLVYL
jgi:hypothetical protein